MPFSMYDIASIITTAIVLPLLGFVSVCLRFYVRVSLTPSSVGLDDWLIAFSCLLVFAQGAMQIVGMSLLSMIKICTAIRGFC